MKAVAVLAFPRLEMVQYCNLKSLDYSMETSDWGPPRKIPNYRRHLHWTQWLVGPDSIKPSTTLTLRRRVPCAGFKGARPQKHGSPLRTPLGSVPCKWSGPPPQQGLEYRKSTLSFLHLTVPDLHSHSSISLSLSPSFGRRTVSRVGRHYVSQRGPTAESAPALSSPPTPANAPLESNDSPHLPSDRHNTQLFSNPHSWFWDRLTPSHDLKRLRSQAILAASQFVGQPS